MTWDFDNLVNYPHLQLKDPDGDGIYETVLVLNDAADEKKTNSEWKQSRDLSAFPQYHSDHVMANALYNMALEEMENAIEPDSTFRTGKEWAGVWTRDISYSIILSMAYLQPEVAKKSLLKKVNGKKKIIQDTGTGGAYPVSTDRMIWAVAAWEIYQSTGDMDWLRNAFIIIKNSIDDDIKNAYDPETGLVKGESSFLDWREQTYPEWMQPADIFESECLGTNAVHYQANIVLAKMAEVLNRMDVRDKHIAIAEKIKQGINQYLWMPDKGYYGQYLYGKNYKILSPRSEALGEALCILFGIADAQRSETITKKVPVTAFGIPCIYPQIPGIPPYHNNGIWPFVQSYWALASAKARNERSVEEAINTVYRPAALFVTNKENFVADNGDFAGTQINSSNMLWSLAGNISLVHKIIFGIGFEKDKIVFKPFIPASLKGTHLLKNFKYRNAILDIEVAGYGNQIAQFILDGKILSSAAFPSNIVGNHSIKIVLKNTPIRDNKINKIENSSSPATPLVVRNNNNISWGKIENAVSYSIIQNGKQIATTDQLSFSLPAINYAEYQVIALDKNKAGSFASAPVVIADNKMINIYEMEAHAPPSDSSYKGFSGTGFIETAIDINRRVTIPIEVKQEGKYSFDIKYANGNGPINTQNKCAIRTLSIDEKDLGTIVLPHRGINEWSNWGFTNSLIVHLKKGKHLVSIELKDHNENMNGKINQAMMDYLRVTQLN